MDPLSPQSQQPAWISASTAEMEVRTRAFIRSVYGWMFGGLLLTSFAAMWVVMSPAMQQLVIANRMVAFGLILAELGIVLFLSFRIMAMSAGAAASAFLVYSFLNGLTLSVIFWAYSQASIVQAFLTAAGMFGAMAVYGLVTKKDLTSGGVLLHGPDRRRAVQHREHFSPLQRLIVRHLHHRRLRFPRTHRLG